MHKHILGIYLYNMYIIAYMIFMIGDFLIPADESGAHRGEVVQITEEKFGDEHQFERPVKYFDYN